MACFPANTPLPVIIGNRFRRRRIPMVGAPDQYCHCRDCGPTPEETVEPLFQRIGDVNQGTNYNLLAADSGKVFWIEGAVSFNLPAAAADLQFSFFQTANNDWSVSDANSAIIARNNLAAAQVAFSTASQKIGSSGTMVAMQLSDTTWHWCFFQHGNHTILVT